MKSGRGLPTYKRTQKYVYACFSRFLGSRVLGVQKLYPQSPKAPFTWGFYSCGEVSTRIHPRRDAVCRKSARVEIDLACDSRYNRS